MSTETQIEIEAELEVARFLASQPTAEAIIAFRLSESVADRAYELIEMERERPLSESESQELEIYLNLEHVMRLVKAEARRRLGHQTTKL